MDRVVWLATFGDNCRGAGRVIVGAPAEWMSLAASSSKKPWSRLFELRLVVSMDDESRSLDLEVESCNKMNRLRCFVEPGETIVGYDPFSNDMASFYFPSDFQISNRG